MRVGPEIGVIRLMTDRDLVCLCSSLPRDVEMADREGVHSALILVKSLPAHGVAADHESLAFAAGAGYGITGGFGMARAG